jgi:hypothetical protein
MHGGYSEQDLATALGITTDQLQAAYTAANTAAVKEAVSKGLITQAQADQITSNGGDLRQLERFGVFNGTNALDYNALLANALGVTTDKLKAAQQQAVNTNLDNAVKNGNMTQAQADEIKGRNALANDAKFQAAMKTAYEAALKQAVSDGVITQAQADAILQSQSQQGGFFGGGPGFGPGPDFGPGHGGHGGFGRPDFNGGPGFNPNNPAPTATPSSS